MSAVLPSRPYQVECGRHFWQRVDCGDTRIPSVMATGLGKTHVFTVELIVPWMAKNPGKRALIIAHTDELINQAYKKMRSVAPHLSVGIVKGAARNEVHAQVIVSSRQTLARDARRRQIRNVGLIVVDEAHHATRHNTYGQILEHFGAFREVCAECVEANDQQSHDMGYDVKCNYCPNDGCATMGRPLVAGFTATLVRSDKAALAEVWQPGKVFSRDIAFGQRHGFLLDVKGKRIVVPDMDMRNVKITAGDYSENDLADELERSLAPQVVAEAFAEVADGRKGIGFAPNVASCYAFAEAFRERGIRTEVVHGAHKIFPLSSKERAAILARLASGETQVVWNPVALGEGFDDPTVDIVIMGRATRYPAPYQQWVGRVLRPNLLIPPAERRPALVLDVVGVGARHHLASLIDLELPDDPYADDMEEFEEEFEPEELVTESPSESEAFEEEVYAGPVEVVDFDPLGRDVAQVWGKTDGGVYFLTAGPDARVFLVPEVAPNEYGIAWVTNKTSTYAFLECPGFGPLFVPGRTVCGCGGQHVGLRGGWANGHRGLSLEAALAWAVDVAEELGGKSADMFGTKKKGWRKSKAVSIAQQQMMMRCGGRYEEGMTKGEVSAFIDQVLATRRIDPVVHALRAQISEEVTA